MSYTPVPNASFSPHNPNVGYYPNHSLSHHSKEEIELGPVGLPNNQSDTSHLSHLPDHKLDAVHLSRAHESQRNTSHGRARGIIRNIWLTAFLPAVAFAYLAFCYASATRVVPVRIYMVDEPSKHLFAIKAGVTTITIIVIGIALLPLKSLLDDLKSEEFFRALRSSKSGVPLKAVNNVSIPSHSFTRGILSIMQNHASKYYAGTMLCTIGAALISSLAPAALSVGVIYVDDGLTAFRVGAVGLDSVFKSDLDSAYPNAKFVARSTEAASMGWVQTVLGVDLTFRPTSSKYAVPAPLDIDPATHARYLTDVIIMDPVCTWTVSNPPPAPPASASAFSSTFNVTLPAFGIGAEVSMSTISSTSSSNTKTLTVLSDDTGLSRNNFMNLTTSDPVTDGTMVWMIAQCTTCNTSSFLVSDKSVFNLSGIPTQEFSYPIMSGNTTTTQTSLISFLVCQPRASVDTREVRLDGTGKIQVMEPSGLKRQGNLYVGQTGLLLGKSLIKYTSDSGPDSGYSNIGKAAQVKLFFGSIPGNSTEMPVLTPQPIEKLTEAYTSAQQAALRSYLSGIMASAYVPGRTQTSKLVFTSSLPHVIVSTVLFACMALFINVCYLRSDTEQFTLFSVAAALAHSNVGRVCEDIRYADRARGALPEDVALKSLENRRIRLANNGGQGHSLHMD